jgi:transposase-like protein
MGLTESTLRKWVNQARINHQSDPQGQLTSTERKELIALRRDLKRVQMERDFLTAVALSGQESLQRGEPPQRAPLGTPPTPCLKKAATFLAQESSDPMS